MYLYVHVCACQSAHDTLTKMPLAIRCFMSIGWIPSEINGFGQITQNLPKILHSMVQPQLASIPQTLHKS